ncbi:MAG: pyrimidine dimer DNA glycosylase/endonuclease V [Nitrospira sp.]|nr:pyrimidine dimer DNA glycosylase/endonuclease V [Nitrospira sp.]
MHIWVISPKKLCRNQLLGEHQELHAIWSVLLQRKKGNAHHPETLRWKGKLKALDGRHEALINEMAVSGLSASESVGKEGSDRQSHAQGVVDPPRQQVSMVKNKHCHCDV